MNAPRVKSVPKPTGPPAGFEAEIVSHRWYRYRKGEWIWKLRPDSAIGRPRRPKSAKAAEAERQKRAEWQAQMLRLREKMLKTRALQTSASLKSAGTLTSSTVALSSSPVNISCDR